MKRKHALSIVISAYNEENKIGACLESVGKLADEIIVVDNTSSDTTREIAKRHTSSVFIRPNNLMLNVNKNFGFTKAKGEWILSLDADERVSHELVDEIRGVVENRSNDVDGYWIPRKNIIFGKWIQHAGWYPDYQRRLFKNGKGSFPEEHVHEMVEVKGKTGYLTHHIVHYNYETVLQFLQKLAYIYAPNEAEVRLKSGYTFEWLDVIRFPMDEFVSRFFARAGYKDGLHGLVLSSLMAFYHLVVFVHIWERGGFRKIENSEFLREVENEWKLQEKKISFWFLNEKMKSAKSLPQKWWLKIQKKFVS